MKAGYFTIICRSRSASSPRQNTSIATSTPPIPRQYDTPRPVIAPVMKETAENTRHSPLSTMKNLIGLSQTMLCAMYCRVRLGLVHAIVIDDGHIGHKSSGQHVGQRQRRAKREKVLQRWFR